MDIPINPISRYIDNIKKNTIEGYSKSKIFKLIDISAVPDEKESRCVRVHILLEKKDPGNSAGDGSEKYLSEQYVLSCALLNVPSDNNLSRLGVEIRYYQRYRESHKDGAFEEKANRLFSSVLLGQ
jgi:hypothetical protein